MCGRLEGFRHSRVGQVINRGFEKQVRTFDTPFSIDVSRQSVEREKAKARALRKSQWWRRQIDKGTCHYCGERIPPNALTMDHIVPLVRGGQSTRGNVVPACKACNSKKKYLLPLEWNEYLLNIQSGKSQTVENAPHP